MAILHFTSKHFGFLVAQVILMESLLLEATPHVKENKGKKRMVSYSSLENSLGIFCDAQGKFWKVLSEWKRKRKLSCN